MTLSKKDMLLFFCGLIKALVFDEEHQLGRKGQTEGRYLILNTLMIVIKDPMTLFK